MLCQAAACVSLEASVWGRSCSARPFDPTGHTELFFVSSCILVCSRSRVLNDSGATPMLGALLPAVRVRRLLMAALAGAHCHPRREHSAQFPHPSRGLATVVWLRVCGVYVLTTWRVPHRRKRVASLSRGARAAPSRKPGPVSAGARLPSRRDMLRFRRDILCLGLLRSRAWGCIECAPSTPQVFPECAHVLCRPRFRGAKVESARPRTK